MAIVVVAKENHVPNRINAKVKGYKVLKAYLRRAMTAFASVHDFKFILKIYVWKGVNFFFQY